MEESVGIMSEGINTLLVDLYVADVSSQHPADEIQVGFAYAPGAPAAFRISIAPKWAKTVPIGAHYVMIRKEVLDQADLTIGPLR